MEGKLQPQLPPLPGKLDWEWYSQNMPFLVTEKSELKEVE
jgi:hypothetical protein